MASIIPPLQPGVTYYLSPVLVTFALQKHAIKWLREILASHDRSRILERAVIDISNGKVGNKRQFQGVGNTHCVIDEHVPREQFYENTRIWLTVSTAPGGTISVFAGLPFPDPYVQHLLASIKLDPSHFQRKFTSRQDEERRSLPYHLLSALVCALELEPGVVLAVHEQREVATLVTKDGWEVARLKRALFVVGSVWVTPRFIGWVRA